MSNQVEIINIALQHLGLNRIDSISENSKAAREAKLIYDNSRDAALSAHDWGFARKRLILALLTETVTEWTYVYQYPVDCIAPREIVDLSKLLRGGIKFEQGANSALTGRVIMTDEREAELKYTARVTDANLYPPGFTDAFSWRLSSDLAMVMLGKPEIQQAHLNQFNTMLLSEGANNSNQEKNDKSEVGRYVGAR